MSAIAGLLQTRSQPVEPSDLERMSAALAAHGPDGHGIWSREAAGLIHRRMCFTPEDRLDQQPIVSPDGQIVLVSAARLDNRPELARSFSLETFQASTLPDAWFILESYLRWGCDCPGHLIGDFTFAVWNRLECSLLLACSPFSGRPLFYHAAGGLFAFATMPKGLFALPGVPRALDEAFLANYLARLPLPPEATFYRDIRRVLPGYRLIVRDDHLDSRPFWQPDLTHDLRLSRDEDYLEAFNALFIRAVQDHTRSATPVGIMLSGGLDSSSVAAVAAPLLRAEGKRLAAFTEVPPAGSEIRLPAGRYADETAFVQALAERYDTMDLNMVHSDGLHLLQDIDRYFYHTETPFRNACNRLWYEAILAEAQRQGCHVLLTGGQGNLGISWQGVDNLPHLVRQGRLRAALRFGLRAFVGRGVLPLLPSPLQSAVRWARSPSVGRPPGSSLGVLRPEAAGRRGLSPKSRRQPAIPALCSPMQSRQLRLDLMQKTASLGSLLGAGYQAQYGVEIRDPTCDVRLVEFCLSLPEEQFRRNGVTRRLLREAMVGRLPPDILQNTKRGLQAADWAERMVMGQEDLTAGLGKIAGCELARDFLDLEGVREALVDVCRVQTQGGPLTIELRNYLEDGFMTGSFIRWFEAGGG